MIKLLITGTLVYFIYRFFIAPPAIDEEPRSSSNQPPQENKHDDEYIDYEEVD
ncbi:MAG: hypothetical protein AAGJ93_15375 [Bacteroidota bacterium]